MDFQESSLYLRCANNNCAETVLSAFLPGVQEYGLPQCVRSDQGSGADKINQHHLEGRSSLVPLKN